jgi:hypothetical protein
MRYDQVAGNISQSATQAAFSNVIGVSMLAAAGTGHSWQVTDATFAAATGGANVVCKLIDGLQSVVDCLYGGTAFPGPDTRNYTSPIIFSENQPVIASIITGSATGFISIKARKVPI